MQVKMLYSRVQSMFRGRGRKEKQMEISAPYDLKKSEKIVLPGISQDEISFLREKAVASRIGIVETLPSSSSSMNSWDARPYTRSSNRSATRSANRSPSRGSRVW